MAFPLLGRCWRLTWSVGGRSLHVGSRRYLPIVALDTNLPSEKLPETFVTDLSAVVAKTLGKQEKYVSVIVNTDKSMSRRGSESPNALLQIWSFEVFDDERNPQYTKDLYKFLLPALNLQPDRIGMFFHPILKSNVASLLYENMESAEK